jgi:hypothetical protein
VFFLETIKPKRGGNDMLGTQVTVSGITDIKTNNQAKVYASILQTVKTYVEVRGEKLWQMLKVASEARAIYGNSPETQTIVRMQFVKAFEEIREDKTIEPANDPTLQSDKATSYRIVKIVFTFEPERIERMKKDGLSFAEVHKRAIKERKLLDRKAKPSDEQQPERTEETHDPIGQGKDISPATRGSSLALEDTDDWLDESLQIINHTFSRFLNMIREARKSGILKGSKLELLKRIIIAILAVGGIATAVDFLIDDDHDGIPDIIEWFMNH